MVDLFAHLRADLHNRWWKRRDGRPWLADHFRRKGKAPAAEKPGGPGLVRSQDVETQKLIARTMLESAAAFFKVRRKKAG